MCNGKLCTVKRDSFFMGETYLPRGNPKPIITGGVMTVHHVTKWRNNFERFFFVFFSFRMDIR
jgi:hypothetical protein